MFISPLSLFVDFLSWFGRTFVVDRIVVRTSRTIVLRGSVSVRRRSFISSVRSFGPSFGSDPSGPVFLVRSGASVRPFRPSGPFRPFRSVRVRSGPGLFGSGRSAFWSFFLFGQSTVTLTF